MKMNPWVQQKQVLFFLSCLLLIILCCILLIIMTDSTQPTDGWQTVNDEISTTLNPPKLDLEDGQQQVGEDTSHIEMKPTGPININHAEAHELETLPGIGPVKAKAIIEYRNNFGPFHAKEDLMKVKGIGPKTYENLANQIIIQ